jgi:hypothetical protein
VIRDLISLEEVAVYHPGRKEAWLAVVTLIVLVILKLTGSL